MEYQVITPETIGCVDVKGKPVLGVSKTAITLNPNLIKLLAADILHAEISSVKIVFIMAKEGNAVDYYIARSHTPKGFALQKGKYTKVGKGTTTLIKKLSGFYKKDAPFKVIVNEMPVVIDNYRAFLMIAPK
jgi:hypothetical protein